MRDGLSQEDRLNRVASGQPFSVIDNSIHSLLRQTEAIASFINYYHLDTLKEDGYFDQFLGDLKQIQKQYAQGIPYEPIGNLEPSQALLLTFIQQLHALTETFNQRWCQYPYWYIDEVLKIKPLPFESEPVWVYFNMKLINHTVTIPRDLKFFMDQDPSKKIWYQLSADFEVNPIEIAKVYSVHCEKQAGIYPTSDLNGVSALKIKDLLNDSQQDDAMFAHDPNKSSSKTLGFMLSSASLLLREGKRVVTITFLSESSDWLKFIDDATQKLSAGEEEVEQKILNNIFYPRISTNNGWERIEDYSLKRSPDDYNSLILRFVLDENFPATEACNQDIHAFESEYPSLRVYLNLDAWLYPYSWIKQFKFNAFKIDVWVERLSNVLVYNELGRIDNSKPFSPFGINTECGTGFIIGNYELSLKNLKSLDLKIEWDQLPNHESGLQGYYKDYDAGIDNCSFRIKPYYLCDYRWKETSNTEPFYLFASKTALSNDLPSINTSLSNESEWNRIRVDKMPMSSIREDEYEYNIQAKTGFINFVLEEPEMGFGEKLYRQLFPQMMLANSLKKRIPFHLNPPITPLIKRMTVNYHAVDFVDVRTSSRSKKNSFFHCYPLENKQVFPPSENDFCSLIYSLETDANLVIALKNVSPGARIHLYFNFRPFIKEMLQVGIPKLEWFWGDGYFWELLPMGSILVDNTNNLLMSGDIEIALPLTIDEKLFDKEGLIWLRIGISEHEAYIPALKKLYTNAACLSLQSDLDLDQEEYMQFKELKGMLVPQKKIPNITAIHAITSFSHRRLYEDQTQRMIRVSEQVTHRGKAVSSRDFEQMTLQGFPEIAKVKCLPNFDSKMQRQGIVTLALIPRSPYVSPRHAYPKVNAAMLFRIENYFKERTSTYVRVVDVINPEYEALTIRCHVKFKQKEHSFGICCSWLKNKYNEIIAPWQEKDELPCFDFQISVKAIFEAINKESYVEKVHSLSVIKLSKFSADQYRIYEYNRGDDLIKPSKPHCIFVPAQEHFISSEPIAATFGIDEMIIDDTFVI